MNVYDQVEKLLNTTQDQPLWADTIIFELRQIKRLLQQMQTPNAKGADKHKAAYFKFVNDLRKQLRADILNDHFPEIHYDGKVLGINFKGHLYDKATTDELSAHEAFAVYRFLYENRENLANYLIK